MIMNRNMRTVFLGFEPLDYAPEILELARVDMDAIFVDTLDAFWDACTHGDVDSVVMSAEGNSTFNLIRTIKSDASVNVPVLVLLPLSLRHLEAEYLLKGADEVLIAPWNIEAMRVRLERMSRKFLTQLGIEGQSGIMKALAIAVEKHDLYTGQHIERLRFLSGQLALTLGLPPRMVASVRAAGLLHDVGKISIPQEILQKPGKLTPKEWEVLRLHPIHGAEITQKLPFGSEISKMVRGHHERWDGKGYPDRLQGVDIPLGARIVSVVDAFDAMTSKRPYRDAISISQAKNQLILGAGTQFDREVIDGFMRLPPAMLEKKFSTTPVL